MNLSKIENTFNGINLKNINEEHIYKKTKNEIRIYNDVYFEKK